MLLFFIFLVTSILNVSTISLKKKTEKGVLKYDYENVLDLSLLFYEAQRSGELPKDNRIPWRQDSCVQCNGPNGADLSGGYYTCKGNNAKKAIQYEIPLITGRTIKFTFPNAAATTIFAWGLIKRRNAYLKAGLLRRVEESLKWGADYLVQCDTGNAIVALVGNTNELSDRRPQSWLRPEDHTDARPYYTITKEKPGTELSGEMSAALAASSIALRKSYPDESAIYLEHAQNLFAFAKKYPGNYTEAVPEAFDFYRSWLGYNDELIWSSLWLYFATKNINYLNYAEEKYEELGFSNRAPNEFSWDDKTNGVKVLMYRAKKSTKYLLDAKIFCNDASNEILLTPKGLFERGKDWGNLRYSSNAAFLCFELGELIKKYCKESNPYLNFTISQIHYALGDTGRSYVIGFGYDWPHHTRHVGSSCLPPPHACTLDEDRYKLINTNILYGALVGGPNAADKFYDTLDNAIQNDVGLDYNAGFQSAVAGLLFLHNENKLPSFAYQCKDKYSYKTSSNFGEF